MTFPGLRDPRVLTALVLTGAGALIVALVLSPEPDVPSRAISVLSRLFSVFPGVGGGARTRDVVEDGLNVLLFVPLGAGLALARPVRGVLWATGFGFWVSVVLETTQAVLLSGRSAQASDVFTNATGCALGYLVVALLLRRRRDARRREREILTDMGRRAP